MSSKQMQIMPPNTNDEQIDDFILSALQNPRDRLTLLKLDVDLERFIKDPSLTRLDFPPMSSYQRLIVHRVAQYFKLEHTAVEIDAQKRAVVLFKTPQTRIPEIRFCDFREKEETPSKTVKIMQRPDENSAVAGKGKTLDNREGDFKSKSKNPNARTLEERELEYQKARARIFNGEASKESNQNDNKDCGDNSLKIEDWNSNTVKELKNTDVENGIKQHEEGNIPLQGRKEEKDRMRKKKIGQISEEKGEQSEHRKDPGRFDNYVEDTSWNNPARSSSFWENNYFENYDCIYGEYNNESHYLANYGPYHNPSACWGSDRYLFQEPMSNPASFGNLPNFPKSFSTPNFHVNGFAGNSNSTSTESSSSINRNSSSVKSLPRTWNVPSQSPSDSTRPVSPGLPMNSNWRNLPDGSFRQPILNSHPSPNGQISPPHSGNFSYDYQFRESQWPSFYPSSTYLRNGGNSYPSLSSYTIQNSSYPLQTFVPNSTPSTSASVPMQSSHALPATSNMTTRQVYDYDRRPPKSTELFDPKASTPDSYSRKPQTLPVVNDVRNSNLRARSLNTDKPFYPPKDTQIKPTVSNLPTPQYNPSQNHTIPPVPLPNNSNHQSPAVLPNMVSNGISSNVVRMRNTWHQAQQSNHLHSMPTTH